MSNMCAPEVSFFKSRPRCCLFNSDANPTTRGQRWEDTREAGQQPSEGESSSSSRVSTPVSTPEHLQAGHSTGEADNTHEMLFEMGVEAVENMLRHAYERDAEADTRVDPRWMQSRRSEDA